MKENSIAEVVEQRRAKNHQFLFLRFPGIDFFALEVCEVELKVAGARGTQGPGRLAKMKPHLCLHLVVVVCIAELGDYHLLVSGHLSEPYRCGAYEWVMRWLQVGVNSGFFGLVLGWEWKINVAMSYGSFPKVSLVMSHHSCLPTLLAMIVGVSVVASGHLWG